MDFLAAHGDLIEPVFKAVQLEHIAQIDIALVDDIGVIARGQRRRNGELRRFIIGGILRRVLARVVIRAPELNGVDQIHKRGGRGAKVGRREIIGSRADLLEHIFVPGGFLIGLQDLHQIFVQSIVFHVLQLRRDGGLFGGLVIADRDLGNGARLGIGLQNGNLFAIGVLDLPDLVVMLMTGESKGNGIGLLDQALDVVGTLVAVHAAVGCDHDHVGLFLHFRLIVLVGLDNIGKIDALPVSGDVPLGNVGVAERNDGHLDAVKVLDHIGLIAFPGLPVLGLVAVGGRVQIVGHADSELLFVLGGGRSGIVQLAVKDVQPVVELMVAHDPHIIADGAERLNGRILNFRLIECVVIGQRCPLNGIAHINGVQVVPVFGLHFFNVRRNTGQTAFIGAAL